MSKGPAREGCGRWGTQVTGRKGDRTRKRQMGRVSPAAVDNADQLLFVTVIPYCQLHLAQRPNRHLRTVERHDNSL